MVSALFSRSSLVEDAGDPVDNLFFKGHRSLLVSKLKAFRLLNLLGLVTSLWIRDFQ